MPKPARRHAVLVAVLVVYLAALALIAFWPVPVDSGARGMLWSVLGLLRSHGWGWIDYAVVEATANVILFVPFGFLLGVLGGPRRRLLMLAICVASSVAIELGQAALLPARLASIGDIAANSAGAVVGALLALGFDRIVRRRDAGRPLDDPADPAGPAGPA
jgi:glycopeptide antibiotics resistance protein